MSTRLLYMNHFSGQQKNSILLKFIFGSKFVQVIDNMKGPPALQNVDLDGYLK